MTIMYGIKNCDTIKKAKTWLTQQHIPFQFHDYRQDGIDLAWLQEVEKHLGWEVMLNKKGTTYRQLPEEDKVDLNKDSALALLLKQPAMIKRPILFSQNHYYCGFSDKQYSEIFNQ
jgi:Spx/MgsR family transcriptional regulator